MNKLKDGFFKLMPCSRVTSLCIFWFHFISVHAIYSVGVACDEGSIKGDAKGTVAPGMKSETFYVLCSHCHCI